MRGFLGHITLHSINVAHRVANVVSLTKGSVRVAAVSRPIRRHFDRHRTILRFNGQPHLHLLKEGHYRLRDNDGFGDAEQVWAELDAVLHGFHLVLAGIKQNSLVLAYLRATKQISNAAREALIRG